jgi:hypothetical protein
VVRKDEVARFQHVAEMLYGLVDGQQLAVVCTVFLLGRVASAAELERRCVSSVLNAATWRERSSILRISVLLLGSGATLVTSGWGAASMMRSAQWPAASESPSGWPARMAFMLRGSRLDQMPRRKSSGTSGMRLLSCLRNWDPK